MRYPLTSNSVISPAAIEAAVVCLRSGWHTMGREVEAFEQEFAAWVGAKHAVMVNSGSSANLLAVEALKLPVGSEVLVPALSWSTSVFPLIQRGLVPVFVDSDPDTLAMDLADAARKFTPKTRALLVIHVLGLAADCVALKQFCLTHDLFLIEDCCEAMGAHWQGHHVGNYGHIGTFSHFYSHQLSTIEGGMCITEDMGLADDLRSMRAHGWSRNRTDHKKLEAEHPEIDPRFLFVTTGYNVRPMELQGAIGRQQLAGLDRNLKERDACAATIIEAVAQVSWLEVIGGQFLASPHARRHERQHSWMNVPIRLREDAPVTRDAVTTILHAEGIDTRPILAGNLTRHPVFAQPVACPVADRVMRDGFMIGCHGDGIAAGGASVSSRDARHQTQGGV
jgi:CDP-6-deoxy-D-xylo-4-hexulose-3-dehydrase